MTKGYKPQVLWKGTISKTTKTSRTSKNSNSTQLNQINNPAKYKRTFEKRKKETHTSRKQSLPIYVFQIPTNYPQFQVSVVYFENRLFFFLLVFRIFEPVLSPFHFTPISIYFYWFSNLRRTLPFCTCFDKRVRGGNSIAQIITSKQ